MLLRRIYTILFGLATPLLLLRLWWRSRHQPDYARSWPERLGRYRGAAPARECIWIHAVSVGESMAAVPLIRALGERFASDTILVTTTTPTGADTFRRMLGTSVRHVYFPYDLPFVLARFLDRFRPVLFIVLETELWPNTMAACRDSGIPVVLANARMSERSLGSYQRVRGLSSDLVRSIEFIAAQTNDDRERFIALGADPARVQTFGSLKFDLELPASVHEEAEALRRELGVNRPILMAGSTRDGEERVVLEAFRRLRESLPSALLVVAARHPERFDEVAGLCSDAGYAITRRSTAARCAPETDVYVLDSMGEMARFYAAADVAFVGGSLLPFGGHNVLEPASLGTPVLVGPHTYNFAEICRLLVDGGVLRVVTDAGDLAAASLEWLTDSNERDRIGARGREIVHAHRGATALTLDVVQELLQRRRERHERRPAA